MSTWKERIPSPPPPLVNLAQLEREGPSQGTGRKGNVRIKGVGSKEQLEIQVGQELELDKWGKLGKVGVPGAFSTLSCRLDSRQVAGSGSPGQGTGGRGEGQDTPERQTLGEKDGDRWLGRGWAVTAGPGTPHIVSPEQKPVWEGKTGQ